MNPTPERIEPLIDSHGGIPFAVRHDENGWWVAFDDERVVGPFVTATQANEVARRDIERRHAD